MLIGRAKIEEKNECSALYLDQRWIQNLNLNSPHYNIWSKYKQKWWLCVKDFYGILFQTCSHVQHSKIQNTKSSNSSKNKIKCNYNIIRLALNYCVNLVKKLFPNPDPIKVYNDRLIRLVAIQLLFVIFQIW